LFVGNPQFRQNKGKRKLLPIWTEIINRKHSFLLHSSIFSELFEAEARASARAEAIVHSVFKIQDLPLFNDQS